MLAILSETFRLVIDQLRQIRRAMSGHTALVDKLNRCIGKINRDVVDAERQLRIGQENLDGATVEDTPEVSEQSGSVALGSSDDAEAGSETSISS